MRTLRRHPRAVAAAAIALGVAAIVVLALLAGLRTPAWHPWWLALVVGGHAVAYVGYAIAYCAMTDLEVPKAWRLVLAGFGAHTVAGGFGFDTRALRGAGRRNRPVVRVLGLGALEWALLAPAAWVCAVIVLVRGGHSHVQGALLWSWAIAVPVGFAIGLSVASPARVRRLESRDGWRGSLHRPLAAVGMLRELLTHPVHGWRAWLGMAAYWTADIASFYGALRCFGLPLGVDLAVLAYATGYAATRRSLPLGGAAVTEVLMALSLRWVGVPLAEAIVPVALYRVVSFGLPAVPALAARERLEPLLRRDERMSDGTAVVRR